MKNFYYLIASLVISIAAKGQIIESLKIGSSSLVYETIATSDYHDFSPSKYGNELLFVSSRQTGLFKARDLSTNQGFLKLYRYNLKTKNTTEFTSYITSESKVKYHYGPSVLLPDSSGLILSRNYTKKNFKDEVNFYLAEYSFSTAKETILPFCTDLANFQHPYYDHKTRRLYFSSDLSGGKGGYDIYFSDRLKDGSWSDPVSIDDINTGRDDIYPTIINGHLYYSHTVSQMGINLYEYNFSTKKISDFAPPVTTSRDEFGMISVGRDSVVFTQSQSGRFNTDLVLAYLPLGSDVDQDLITNSKRNESLELTATNDSALLVNSGDSAGYLGGQSQLIVMLSNESNRTLLNNTLEYSQDDFRVVEVDGQQFIVLSASKMGGEGIKSLIDNGEGAYLTTDSFLSGATIMDPEEREDDETIESIAIDNRTARDYAEGVKIVTGVLSNKNAANRVLEEVLTWSNQAYVSYYNGKYYVISGIAQSDLEVSQSLAAAEKNGIDGAWISKEHLQPILESNNLGSPDLVVYFRFDSDNIQEKYANQIAAVMQSLDKPVDGVFILGHTDSRGSKKYNLNLSEKRSERVAEFIAEKLSENSADFFKQSRGESELVNKCYDENPCDEYAHFLNRRVEIWFK